MDDFYKVRSNVPWGRPGPRTTWVEDWTIETRKGNDGWTTRLTHKKTRLNGSPAGPWTIGEVYMFSDMRDAIQRHRDIIGTVNVHDQNFPR